MKLSGEQLYAIYKSKSRQQGVIVDEWEDLDDTDRAAWCLTAIEVWDAYGQQE